ncbi:MAG: 30S ribosomal protein S1 [Parcubacteria group bacterium SW_6_46_9]|nr:MAG: 30S ribosomal protein S1 [Parcubacteria group bacterium SW_6_46_9]
MPQSTTEDSAAESTSTDTVGQEPEQEPEDISQDPIKKDHLDDDPMETVYESSVNRPDVGDIVAGEVIAVDTASVYIDLPPHGTGIIYGREYINARNIIRNITVGDDISAKVVEPENNDGYVELSLKEARQAIVWAKAEEAMQDEEVFNLTVKDANKGGLLLDWEGIRGFLPASQLKPEHYPRVEGGDKDRILQELKELVGDQLTVSIITADPEEEKLIFSEKSPSKEEKEAVMDTYEVGEVIEGTVTGIVDFGVFIEIEEGLEGLAHISELDWGLVEDPGDLFEVGETVTAKIIDKEEDQVSLSIKELKENPWIEAADTYHAGQEVSGVIIKFNEHGALAAIEEGVAGLVHVSEFASMEALRDTLELGRTYQFEINLFEPREQRMALSYKGDDGDDSKENADDSDE